MTRIAFWVKNKMIEKQQLQCAVDQGKDRKQPTQTMMNYEQSIIFLWDSWVGEHASVRENHLEETRRASPSRLSLRKMRDCSYL